MSRPVKRWMAALVCAGTALSLAGCGGDNAEVDLQQKEQSTRTDVPFTGCDEAACTGDIDGAAYEIRMPETWNGTLLLYSHGYRQAEPSPPPPVTRTGSLRTAGRRCSWSSTGASPA